MAQQQPNRTFAACALHAAEEDYKFLINNGFVTDSLTRNGAGDYSLKTDQGVDALECVSAFAARGQTPAFFAIEHVDDNEKRIRTFAFDGETLQPTDVDFDLTLYQAASGVTP